MPTVWRQSGFDVKRHALPDVSEQNSSTSLKRQSPDPRTQVPETPMPSPPRTVALVALAILWFFHANPVSDAPTRNEFPFLWNSRVPFWSISLEDEEWNSSQGDESQDHKKVQK